MQLSFLTMPRLFSTIKASVVGLEAVDKSSTPVSGNAPEFLKIFRKFFRP